MGLEATCIIRKQRTRWEARVLLETDELRVRGERPIRVPFAQITRVEAKNGTLQIDWASESLSIELGTSAEKWAERIRSPRSLLDKLGVTTGDDVVALGALDEALLAELRTRATVRVARSAATVPDGAKLVFTQAASRAALDALEPVTRRLARDGAIWVVHPKGKDGLADTVVFEVAKAAGLTATKVARISDTLTAEKLVIPRSAR